MIRKFIHLEAGRMCGADGISISHWHRSPFVRVVQERMFIHISGPSEEGDTHGDLRSHSVDESEKVEGDFQLG